MTTWDEEGRSGRLAALVWAAVSVGHSTTRTFSGWAVTDPNSTERVFSDGEPRSASAPPARRVMLTWQGLSGPALESVRLLLSGGLRFRAHGRLIDAPADDRAAFSADFELTVDEAGIARRLLVHSTTLEQERQISLSRNNEGGWLVDDGTGARRGEFGDALDVHVEGVALFHSIPIRRLGLHRERGEHSLPVVFVSLPTLSITLATHTYRTVSVRDDTSNSVVRYAQGAYAVNLTVDSDGTVVEFPDLCHRV